MIEGSSIQVFAAVSDDVQVSNVELLVDGEVVANDVSFPFELTGIAQGGVPAPTTIEVRTKASDTGGNSALSNTLVFDLVPDTVPPSVLSISPENGEVLGMGLRAVRIRFSEPMASDTVTPATFRLLGPDGSPVAPQNIKLRKSDRAVQLTYAPLAPGIYELVIQSSEVTDRAGNPLGAQDLIVRFVLLPEVTYFGYNPRSAGALELVGWQDGTTYEIVDLDNRTAFMTGTLQRFETANVPMGEVRHFKLRASGPLLAILGADSFSQGANYFYPSLDGRTMVGQEFIIRTPVLSNSNEFIIFAYEDSEVTVRDSARSIVTVQNIPADGFYATTGAPLSRFSVYTVESTGSISIMSNAQNGNTAVPSSNGTDVGTKFLLGTHGWERGAVAVFAYADAVITGTNLVSGAEEFTRTLLSGDFAYIGGLGTNKYSVTSTGKIAVWAGDTEAGDSIQSMGDDLTINVGDRGRDFLIHTQTQGAFLFAFEDGTSVVIDGAATTLNADQFIDPEPGALHRITSDSPVIVETIGGNALNDWYAVLRLVPADELGAPPTVFIVAPTPGETVIEGATLPIRVAASDDVAVAAVELLVDGQAVARAISSPFTFELTVPTGVNSLTIGARAEDLGGNVGVAARYVDVALVVPVHTVSPIGSVGTELPQPGHSWVRGGGAACAPRNSPALTGGCWPGAVADGEEGEH